MPRPLLCVPEVKIKRSIQILYFPSTFDESSSYHGSHYIINCLSLVPDFVATSRKAVNACFICRRSGASPC